jgi:carboxylesterase
LLSLQKSAVVLLHGLYSTTDELLSLKGPLQRHGANVISFEIEGYTFDINVKKPVSSPFEAWVLAVKNKVRSLKAEGFEKVFLVGISTGAALALASTMEKETRSDGLVLLSTSLVQDGWSIPPWHFMINVALYTPLGVFWHYKEKPPFGVKNERIRNWIKRELEQRKISRAGVANLGITHLKQNDRLNRFVKKNLSLVSCPQILAIHAQEDEVASTHNLTILSSGLKSSVHLQKIIVNNSYHMISIDNDRQQVIQETLHFLKSLSRPETEPSRPQ